MSDSRWEKASTKTKEHVVRLFNGERLGVFVLKEIPGWDRRQTRELPSTSRQLREEHEAYLKYREPLEIFAEYRKRGSLPPGVRRCKHSHCSRCFIAPKSRSDKTFCDARCSRNSRQSKFKKSARKRKLEAVHDAMKTFGSLPDWKEKSARRARVSKNFVTYAVRRQEL